MRATALIKKLTDAQWTRMVTYSIERLTAVDNELSTWRRECERSRRESEGDMNDRMQEREQNIFMLSNESTGLVQGAAEFVRARIKEDMFGSEPYIMVVPEMVSPVAGQETPDEVLAQQINEHAKWKLRGIGWKTAARDNIDNIIDLGTGILKHSHKRKVKKHWRYANVLVRAAEPGDDPKDVKEGADGKEVAVTTGAGDYIFDSDKTVTHLKTQGAGGTDQWHPQDEVRNGMHNAAQAQPGYDPQAVDAQADGLEKRTMPAKDLGVKMDLGTDGTPGSHKWSEWLIEDEVVLYDDALTESVHEQRFSAPLNFACIEDVDFCAHTYDVRLSDVRAMLGLPPNRPTDEEGGNLYDAAKHLLAQIKTETSTRKAPAAAAAKNAGQPEHGDDDNPWVKVAESYMDYDPLGDGITTRVYLVILPDLNLGIRQGCDYLANVTPGAKYPFSISTIFQRKGKWIGMGFMEIFRCIITSIERMMNSMIYRNDIKANPMIGVHEDAAEEDVDEIKVGPGVSITLKNDKTMKDLIDVLVLPDTDQFTYKLMEALIDMFQLRSTVSSMAQGDVASLPQVNTATGTNAVLASGSTVSNELLEQIKGEVGRNGLLDGLDKIVELIYTRQNRAETFAYGDGQFRKVATLTPQDVQDLTMHVHLLLTRFRQKQDTDNAQQALGAVLKYIQVPEQEKGAIRPLVEQIVKGYGFDNADAIVRQPVPPDPNAGVQTPPEALSINYKDAPEDIKRQMEQKAGFTPSALPPPPADGKQQPPAGSAPGVPAPAGGPPPALPAPAPSAQPATV